ncbi:MAG: 23S rRNA (adenine(2503)-C(2))-methyltransferase RlmN, partial [Lachnospiraceae bacterium]|nr:23S rRNA (adenine(2503)-C(2))-methyltransferase RlmN [Lachnospiraceae bacterium]
MDAVTLKKEELTDIIVNTCGEKKFRASQVFEWIHKRHVKDYSEMLNVPQKLKDELATTIPLNVPEIMTVQESRIDGTRKYLFKMHDGQMIESVFMRYKHGNSVCISSQAGCRMGCRFCASTLDGLVRNLTAGEMLSQIYQIERDMNEKVSNIVVMGTGEPLDNYDNLVRFIELISDEEGMNLSQRNITVSTCGLIPKINELAERHLQITLAISLHAPNQKDRAALMPVANSFEIHDLINTCKNYFDKTGRRISFEYSLVHGKNDSMDQADELSKLIRGINAHVNLIPVNPIKERDYKAPDRRNVLAFKERL